MRYDAFISYRHGGLDGAVAEKLHRMLESYVLPAALSKKLGIKRLGKVFRDREELPTSSNLSDSINEALQESKFLILICSRRLRESIWCMQEVDTFIRIRGRQNILAILIEGEPDEAFPEQIRWEEIGGEMMAVEPLAADIRADSQAASLRLLKREHLRLAAPIVGCAYDDLWQRQRRRQRRRITAAVSACMAVVLAFGITSFVQYLRVDEALQKQLISQSYTLAEYSLAARKDSDALTATMLALEALPEDLQHPDRPYVSAAEHALARALDVYNYGEAYLPIGAMDTSLDMYSLKLSPNNTSLAATGAMGGIMLFSVPGMERLAKLSAAVNSHFLTGAYIDDNTYVYPAADGLSAWDIAAGKTLWTADRPCMGMSLSADGKTIYVLPELNSAHLDVYNTNGEFLQELVLSKQVKESYTGDIFTPYITVFWINADETRALVSYFDDELVLINLGTGEETTLFPEIEPTFVDWKGDMLAVSTLLSDTFQPEDVDFSEGSAVYFYNTKTGELADRIVSEYRNCVGLIRGNGKRLYTEGMWVRSLDDTIVYESIPTEKEIFSLWEFGEYIVVGMLDGVLYFMNPETGRIEQYLQTGRAPRLLVMNEEYLAVSDLLDQNTYLFSRQGKVPMQEYRAQGTVFEAYVDMGHNRMVVVDDAAISSYALDSGALLGTAACSMTDTGICTVRENVVTMANVITDTLTVYDANTMAQLDYLEGCLAMSNDCYMQDGLLLVVNFAEYAASERIAIPPEASWACRAGGRVFYVTDDGLFLQQPPGQEDTAIGAYDVMAAYDGAEDSYLLLWDGQDLFVYSVGQERILSTIGMMDTWLYDVQFIDGRPYVLLYYERTAYVHNLETGELVADLTYETHSAWRMHVVEGKRPFLVMTYSPFYFDQFAHTMGVIYDLKDFSPLATIDRLFAVLPDGTAIVGPKQDVLYRIPLYDTETLIRMGQEVRGGRDFTALQKSKYHLTGS